VREAQELLDAGRPFHAHEVLEDAWKTGPDDERDLWRGLAQLAVGLTHAARGNPAGAATLFARGARSLGTAHAAAARHGVDDAGLIGWACRLAAAAQTGDPLDLTPPRLRTD
jgi:predicted metal-dependent hydrolase